jgi:hypothetical protein
MVLARFFPLTLGLAALLACDAADNAHSEESVAVAAQLRACNLVSAGQAYAPVGDTEVARCEARCVIEGTCGDVQKLYCETYLTWYMRDCLDACHAPRRCEQGTGTYTLGEVCDGEEQCRDGSDEFDCPSRPADDEDAPTTCLSTGNAFAAYERCDGVAQCEDATDEQGCPNQGKLFTCETLVAGYVRKIAQSAVCNLKKDCPDGSDESDARGCAQLTCPKP